MHSYRRKPKKELDTVIKVNIPKKVQDQIKHLCNTINTIEWSGPLFYSMEGSIEDPKNLVITLEEILPLDIGTSGYTEYRMGPAVSKFMRENEVFEKGWKMGHIHSHHNMGVFFSGTDQSEIEDNSENHNFYLSVIVNNKGEIIGKVGITAECDMEGIEEEIGFKGINEEGEEYIIESVMKNSSKKYFEYKCKITNVSEEPQVSEEFKELMSKMTRHNRSEFDKFPSNNSYSSGGNNKKWRYLDDEDEEQTKGTYSWTPKSKEPESRGTITPTVSEVDGLVDEFVFKVFSLEDPACMTMSGLDDILEYWTAMDKDPDELAKEILKKYDEVFPVHYEKVRMKPRFYVLRTMKERLANLTTPANVSMYKTIEPTIKALNEKYDNLEIEE